MAHLDSTHAAWRNAKQAAKRAVCENWAFIKSADVGLRYEVWTTEDADEVPTGATVYGSGPRPPYVEPEQDDQADAARWRKFVEFANSSFVIIDGLDHDGADLVNLADAL